MFFIKIIKNAIIISFCCLLALSAHSFPKKKHSIIKDKLEREKYENFLKSGYLYGYMEYCNYVGALERKERYKRVKGLIAYTNWDLFLTFNRGIQDLHGTLVAAGVGWAGSSGYATNQAWTQHQINWKHDLEDGCPTRSMNRVYNAMDEIINNELINFMLKRDNFQSNLSQLISALERDKKDDYSAVIIKIKNATDPNYSPEETEGTNDSASSNSSNNSNDESSGSIREQLKKLKNLYEDELISEDDYNNKKKELLDKI